MGNGFASERLRRQGVMLEKQNRARAMENRISAMIMHWRAMTDPAIVRLADIDCENLLDTSTQIAALLADYQEISKEISLIRRALGVE